MAEKKGVGKMEFKGVWSLRREKWGDGGGAEIWRNRRAAQSKTNRMMEG